MPPQEKASSPLAEAHPLLPGSELQPALPPEAVMFFVPPKIPLIGSQRGRDEDDCPHRIDQTEQHEDDQSRVAGERLEREYTLYVLVGEARNLF